MAVTLGFMGPSSRPPVAVRVIRPHGSLEEFYGTDLGTITATTIVLLGAQRRPEGVVLRFEVLLSDETPVVRGEGRVIGYMDRTPLGEPGLCVKLLRVDPRSKEVLDEALLRKGQAPVARRSIAPDAPPSRRAPPPLPPKRPVTPVPPEVTLAVDVTDVVMLDEPAPSEAPPAIAATPVEVIPSDERSACLGRLRSRFRELSPEARDAIAEAGRAFRARTP